MNPGFSSTKGVQIAMSRFNEVTFDPTSDSVTVGAGLIWDDVYAALEPHSAGVVGGRVSGIGVAGFTLGGGAFVASIDHASCLPGFDEWGCSVRLWETCWN